MQVRTWPAIRQQNACEMNMWSHLTGFEAKAFWGGGGAPSLTIVPSTDFGAATTPPPPTGTIVSKTLCFNSLAKF